MVTGIQYSSSPSSAAGASGWPPAPVLAASFTAIGAKVGAVDGRILGGPDGEADGRIVGPIVSGVEGRLVGIMV